MATSVRPFLMFEGKAEEAMNFYVSLLPRSEILSVQRYGQGEPGPEGSVRFATFSVAGQAVNCIDSFVKHGFTFTPSFSFFVDCESEEEIRRAVGALLDGGEALMPLGDYGFARLFAWVKDRFGVSWQLQLA